ncbi:hypothetical protein L873DRAFT_1315060 [Choiromyces venosus 120613-1]|uniref:Uncharacterized protein n=1 Tax=Choiromyces venosus 120613-1 TaxID=1336337 RepID=A0A3N4JB57_9PEZI|nr:hypothetical protein L873DRAFT_1315060 [Choiromyces venosus 120613-1]
MSGSGFYKFRCKNWLTYDCKQWVWVNNSACAECIAVGRDAEDMMDGERTQSPCETTAPSTESRSLAYAVLECKRRFPDEIPLIHSSEIPSW